MASFYLQKSDFLADIKCPHCGQGHDIEWDTEYGDPLLGQDSAECLECEEKFGFESQTVYTTWKQ